MSIPRALSATLAAAIVAAPTVALAGAKASWGDRVDQIIETFMGDPAAGVDIDMKHVLDKWRDMHPKPLETLSPEDARRQPSPIDAAQELARDSHVPLVPTGVSVKDLELPRAGRRPAQGQDLFPCGRKRRQAASRGGVLPWRRLRARQCRRLGSLRPRHRRAFGSHRGDAGLSPRAGAQVSRGPGRQPRRLQVGAGERRRLRRRSGARRLGRRRRRRPARRRHRDRRPQGRSAEGGGADPDRAGGRHRPQDQLLAGGFRRAALEQEGRGMGARPVPSQAGGQGPIRASTSSARPMSPACLRPPS